MECVSDETGFDVFMLHKEVGSPIELFLSLLRPPQREADLLVGQPEWALAVARAIYTILRLRGLGLLHTGSWEQQQAPWSCWRWCFHRHGL